MYLKTVYICVVDDIQCNKVDFTAERTTHALSEDRDISIELVISPAI